MKIMQPYVQNYTLDYQNINVSNSNICEYYEFKEKENTKIINAVPDGCVDLMYAISKNGVKCYLGGTVLKLKYWPFEENSTYFGVRFLPGQEILPKNVSIEDIVNTDIELPVDCYGVNLEDELYKAKDMRERATLMHQIFLKQSCLHTNSKRSIELYIRKRIYETKGTVSIKTISKETGYSQCYVRRIFHELHGISPKIFEKIIRFQNVLERMSLNRDLSIYELAQESGYYDQSHMLKEFKQYMGMTPELYKKCLQQKKAKEKGDII
ncbi:MAG: AraC family transcriptional regulator [Anaerostipes sp.]|nr:AraC family transcriptional regulator [Anaerostipes sp.]